VANITTCASSNLPNLVIASINATLTPPGSLSALPLFKSNANTTCLSSLVQLINSTGGQGMGEAILEVANETRGFTFFAPNNAAVQRAMGQLGSLKNNETALVALFGNHVSLVFLVVYMSIHTDDKCFS
jgi:uncharacterized surface protein with fasciclin (FAS1) repeats